MKPVFNTKVLRELVNKAVFNCVQEDNIVPSIANGEMFRNLSGPEKTMLEQEIRVQIREHGNYTTVQNHVNSKIVVLNKGKELVLFDPITLVTRPTSIFTMGTILNKKLVTHNFVDAISTYNPRKAEVLYNDPAVPGCFFYNSYRPANWLWNYFYSGEIPPKVDLPEIYHDFFMHLVGGDEASFKYLLKWSAYSVKNKNDTALAFIGKQGVGKGMFAEILARVHRFDSGGSNLHSNYGTKAGNQLESKFNPEFAEKTLVQIDEFSMRNSKAEDVFKQLTNRTLTIEKKGIDARAEHNFANIILTSNRIDQVRISPNDRRFSFIDLTDTKVFENASLIGKWGSTFIPELHSEENIGLLGCYLWHLADTLEHDEMKQTFTSKKLLEIRKTALLEWEQEFLASYIREHAGETVLYTKVKEDLELQLNTRFKNMSVDSFKRLVEKIAPILGKDTPYKTFTVDRPRTSGKRPNNVIIAPIAEQPPETFFENHTEVESE